MKKTNVDLIWLIYWFNKVKRIKSLLSLSHLSLSHFFKINFHLISSAKAENKVVIVNEKTEAERSNILFIFFIFI